MQMSSWAQPQYAKAQTESGPFNLGKIHLCIGEEKDRFFAHACGENGLVAEQLVRIAMHSQKMHSFD